MQMQGQAHSAMLAHSGMQGGEAVQGGQAAHADAMVDDTLEDTTALGALAILALQRHDVSAAAPASSGELHGEHVGMDISH